MAEDGIPILCDPQGCVGFGGAERLAWGWSDPELWAVGPTAEQINIGPCVRGVDPPPLEVDALQKWPVTRVEASPVPLLSGGHMPLAGRLALQELATAWGQAARTPSFWEEVEQNLPFLMGRRLGIR